MEVELKIVGEVSVLKLQPGDFVMLKVKTEVTPKHALEVKTVFEAFLRKAGFQNEVIVLSNHMDVEVARNGEKRSLD